MGVKVDTYTSFLWSPTEHTVAVAMQLNQHMHESEPNGIVINGYCPPGLGLRLLSLASWGEKNNSKYEYHWNQRNAWRYEQNLSQNALHTRVVTFHDLCALHRASEWPGWPERIFHPPNFRTEHPTPIINYAE